LRATHIWSGAVLAALSLVCLFWVIPATTSPPDSPLDLAPSFIPMVSVSVVLVLSVVLALTALRQRQEDASLDDEFGADATGMGRREFVNLGFWTLAAAGAWVVMRYVGFEPAMTLFLVAVLTYLGLRNFRLVAVIAIATPIVLAQFVWYVFEIQVPGFWR